MCLFNDALNTCYLWSYGVGHKVKNHSDKEETSCQNACATVSDEQQGSFNDSTYYGLCYISHGALAGSFLERQLFVY